MVLLYVFLGLAAGVLIMFFINRVYRQELTRSLINLSQEALRQNAEDFLRLANENLAKHIQTGTGELEIKKKLIDQSLENIRENLQRVEHLMSEIENKREESFGKLSEQLKVTAEQTSKLQETTGKLQTALSSSRIRGQWGERMAEDILNIAGFVEGVSYIKQKTQQDSGSRPDYTFLLPQNLKIHMDVKFPLDNYIKYINENNEIVRENYKQQFLKDARQRIKEVTTRDYINPANNTLDYVIVFIPNEQVYSFIHTNDQNIMDDALKNKVIMCSPMTLYAILAVIKQATYIFNLNKTTSEIMKLLNDFYKQWGNFKESMETLGKRIESVQREYQLLVTTRSNRLDKPLEKINELYTRENSELIEEQYNPQISEKTQ